MEAEPWTNKVYVDNKLLLEKYIELEQPNSKIDLKNRMFLNSIDPDLTENDVYIILDCNKLRNEDFQNLIKINQILSQLDGETNVVGTYEIDNITIKVNRLKNIINEFVNI